MQACRAVPGADGRTHPLTVVSARAATFCAKQSLQQPHCDLAAAGSNCGQAAAPEPSALASCAQATPSYVNTLLE